ncbi:MAG: hypothetical protein Tsb0026_20420 [Sulfuricaulis sp.]
MSSSIEEFLAVVLPPFAGAALVMFLAKNWFLERLRGSIKSEYDQKLVRLEADLSARNTKEIESIKALLERDAVIIAAAQKAFADSHSSSQPLKIEAVKELWEALLHIQRNSPSVFAFLDVLLPNEYGKVLGTKQLKTFNDITTTDIEKIFNGKPTYAQNHRLLSGDYLWSLFYAYQSLSARIAFLFMMGREKQNVTPWQKDSGCISIVRSVCTSTEFEEFEKKEFGQITWVRQLIESKFLYIAHQILDGRASADIALEEAKRITLAASTANKTAS